VISGLRCEKCGSQNIGTRWHASGRHCSWFQRYDRALGEHLHRTCRCCEFHWADAVLGRIAEKPEYHEQPKQDIPSEVGV
jgi:hypothetical protein